MTQSSPGPFVTTINPCEPQCMWQCFSIYDLYLVWHLLFFWDNPFPWRPRYPINPKVQAKYLFKSFHFPVTMHAKRAWVGTASTLNLFWLRSQTDCIHRNRLIREPFIFIGLQSCRKHHLLTQPSKHGPIFNVTNNSNIYSDFMSTLLPEDMIHLDYICINMITHRGLTWYLIQSIKIIKINLVSTT